jgi:pyruvate formate lyase activating enzyme
MLRLHSIETFGTHDGPGIRLVLFTQGCNMRCLYCHNPDTQPMENDQSRLWSTAELLELLQRQRNYFNNGGGLTVSGGEPVLQACDLSDLFHACRKAGIHTCLDTSGSLFNKDTRRLYDLTDLVLLDVKHIDPTWHKRLTGMDNQAALENAAYRESSGKEMWLRYVLVPEFSDQEEHLHAWGQQFAAYKSVTRVELLPYHELGVHKYKLLGRRYELSHIKPPTTEQVRRAAEILRQYFGSKLIVA